MRVIRTIAFAAAICTLAACAATPTLPNSATAHRARNTGGFVGSGSTRAVPAGPSFDGTTPTDAPGTMGSGNRSGLTGTSGTTTTTSTSEGTTDPATMGSGNLLEGPTTMGSGN